MTKPFKLKVGMHRKTGELVITYNLPKEKTLIVVRGRFDDRPTALVPFGTKLYFIKKAIARKRYQILGDL
jgi:hypothetical protein